MKRLIFYLFALATVYSMATQGCSENEKPGPEVPPEPGGDTTVTPPPPQPWMDTVVMLGSVVITESKFDLRKGYRFSAFVYNEEGRLIKFSSSYGRSPRWENDSVVVEWADKKVTMRYNENNVQGAACVATYTLNDKWKMEKVVLETPSGTSEYKAEYTAEEFKMIDAAGNKELYSAKIAKGGVYGDWTMVKVSNRADNKPDITVHVEYAPDAKKNYSRMDLLLVSNRASLGMPKCIVWANIAGLLPGSTKLYYNLTADYGSKTSMHLYKLKTEISTEEQTILKPDTKELGEALQTDLVWGLPVSIDLAYPEGIKVFEREGK